MTAIEAMRKIIELIESIDIKGTENMRKLVGAVDLAQAVIQLMRQNEAEQAQKEQEQAERGEEDGRDDQAE